MTLASPESYAHMLDQARRGAYAYPAINVTSTQTLNAALQGFADAQSDGIIQVSVGGASYLSGQRLQDRVAGSIAFARFAAELISHYKGITIALHTDHCAPQYLDEWVRPLLAYEREQVEHGEAPLFQSHMWDGSTLPLERNLTIARELLAQSRAAHTVLELEVGAVGGEEDGQSAQINEKLYSSPADGMKVIDALGLGEQGRYMVAFTFGNVHGAYKPGVVKLRPELLREIQTTTAQAIRQGELAQAPKQGEKSQAPKPNEPAAGRALAGAPDDKPFLLVFHGGSGSPPAEIAQAVSYGVVKMNVDTDTQYAFTRGVAGHMFRDYDKVLKIDGEVGEKSAYDPRSWGREAEDSMAARVVLACQELGSAGRALR
ncbi:class II fructose-bisphosphate aldolase [Bombiscardovia nodaiensis]|uniref:Fructose-bisphosphate aldolase n=1 Tax=Bombiscardovia nodaiensis TaxID=2932181 RepID=A0ABM8BA99_9BIFI|nr:class II fructose-bisphosphate aldolase [Bombiscardovia nodaiensis]